MLINDTDLRAALRQRLRGIEARAVTGPGRSGAIASALASHMLGVPFIPFGQPCPAHLRPLLIVDTARKTGRTLRRAVRQYGEPAVAVVAFEEPPRVRFWYEGHDAGR